MEWNRRIATRGAPWAMVLIVAGACGGTANREEATLVSEVGDPVRAAVAAAKAEQVKLLPNGRIPVEGLLVGGQPTLEQFQDAQAAGYRSVINIRTPKEPAVGREAIEALGMSYHTLPIAGADGLTEENARALSRMLEELEGPTILHCGSGNRVGGLLALKAYFVDGKSPEEALQFGLDAGLTRLEPVVRERLGMNSESAD